jgi:hypothetical protein
MLSVCFLWYGQFAAKLFSLAAETLFAVFFIATRAGAFGCLKFVRSFWFRVIVL